MSMKTFIEIVKYIPPGLGGQALERAIRAIQWKGIKS